MVYLDIDNKRVKVQIWDVAGQKRFRTIAQAYYRGADGLILVYDISNKSSFSKLKEWVDPLENDTKLIKAVIANKTDIMDQESAKFQQLSAEGKKYAKELNCSFYHASARTESIVAKELLASIVAKMMDDT